MSSLIHLILWFAPANEPPHPTRLIAAGGLVFLFMLYALTGLQQIHTAVASVAGDSIAFAAWLLSLALASGGVAVIAKAVRATRVRACA